MKERPANFLREFSALSFVAPAFENPGLQVGSSSSRASSFQSSSSTSLHRHRSALAGQPVSSIGAAGGACAIVDLDGY